MLTDENIEEYRNRVRIGNKYRKGPLADVEVNYLELSRYDGIVIRYKDSGHIGYEFGYRNKIDIENLLNKFGY